MELSLLRLAFSCEPTLSSIVHGPLRRRPTMKSWSYRSVVKTPPGASQLV
jgi:hypothetical protein